MPTDVSKESYVTDIRLSQEVEKRVAYATVQLGEVTIRGVAVFRSGNGRLAVYFPSYRLGSSWLDAIELPAELRSQVEADVISAYKAEKAAARQKQQPEVD